MKLTTAFVISLTQAAWDGGPRTFDYYRMPRVTCYVGYSAPVKSYHISETCETVYGCYVIKAKQPDGKGNERDWILHNCIMDQEFEMHHYLGGCSGKPGHEICYRFCHTNYCNDGVGGRFAWNDGELAQAYQRYEGPRPGLTGVLAP